MKLVLDLTKEDLTILKKEVHGQGGWQALLLRLQSKIKKNTLVLDLKDLHTVVQYLNGNNGGFQKRLGTVMNKVKDLTDALQIEMKTIRRKIPVNAG